MGIGFSSDSWEWDNTLSLEDRAERRARQVPPFEREIMPIGTGFNRNNATAGTKAAPKKPKGSKYGGVQAAQDRDPMPLPGLYRVRVVECEETSNPRNGEWFRATLEIVEAADAQSAANHPVNSRVVMVQQVSGSGAVAGLPRVKSFVMAAAGFEDESEYDKFDPQGDFIDAQVGVQNDFSQHLIVGRLVDMQVTRGKDTTDGRDFYRNYAWAVVPDAEQDTA